MRAGMVCRLLALLCVTAVAYGQLTRGFISGTVQDSSNALVQGVNIEITNVETGIRHETATNNTGVYRFVAVEPGFYDIEFAKSGFLTTKVERIQVGTTQEVVVNQTLSVSNVTTTVEVLEAPVGVELAKSTAAIDRTLDAHLVEMIPSTAVTRDMTQLALLAPMAVRGTGSTQISVNGQRARNNNFVIDGVDNNDLSVTLPNIRLLPEAVAEFHVQSAPY